MSLSFHCQYLSFIINLNRILTILIKNEIEFLSRDLHLTYSRQNWKSESVLFVHYKLL